MEVSLRSSKFENKFCSKYHSHIDGLNFPGVIIPGKSLKIYTKTSLCAFMAMLMPEGTISPPQNWETQHSAEYGKLWGPVFLFLVVVVPMFIAIYRFINFHSCVPNNRKTSQHF